MVYLDYAATTPLRPEARTAMLAAMDMFGNPSSVHGYGQAARAVLDESRRTVAEALAVRAERVVFTASATEANNLALRGAMVSIAGRTLLVGATEHESVRATAHALSAIGVCRTEVIPCDAEGVADEAWLATRLQAGDVGLVSLMHANNETGVIQPVPEVAALARRHGALMHTDAVQTVGHMPVTMEALGVDMLTLTAHKFGGPKGAAALVVKPELKMQAHTTGGGQERNRRAGTENIVALAGMAAALQAAMANMPAEQAMAQQLADRLEAALPAGMIIAGGAAPKMPHVRLVLTPNLAGDMLVMKADVAGVAISQGSACSSGRVEPSAVLQAMGLSPQAALQAVRLSWGWGSGVADMEEALQVLAVA